MEANSKIAVSVCISVHNTAKYLPRCLDSVCSQTLKDMEIVLVNNGSTDNSELIMRDYEKQHPERKIVIFSQEDKGLAQGRQSGINNSSGKYITFLDADDYVEPTAYEKMLRCAERECADIVEIETLRDGKVISSSLSGLHSSHDVLRQYFTKGGIPSMLWMRLYKRKLFEKTVLPDIYINNEDNFALPCLLYAARSIFFINEPLHTYSTDNELGIMHSETVNRDLAERRFQSRTKALLSIPFFRQFAGKDGLKEFEKDFNLYSSIYIFNFLLTKFIGKNMADKEKAIIETLKIHDKKELYDLLKQYLPKSGFNSYGIFRTFGIKAAYIYLIIRNNN